MSAHAPAPLPGSAYTVGGPRDNREVDDRLARSFPATAICAGCGEMLSREAQGEPWKHAGRMPGSP